MLNNPYSPPLIIDGDYTEDPNFDLQDYMRFRESCPDPAHEDEEEE